MVTEPPRAKSPSNDERRLLVAEIIRTSRVRTQHDLGEALEKRGVRATQATLSRDLAALKARRISLPNGGTIYELDAAGDRGDDDVLSLAREMVLGVSESMALVVVRTNAGAASLVADSIDRAKLALVCGTIAGDDTVFVAPVKKASVSVLCRELRSAWGRA